MQLKGLGELEGWSSQTNGESFKGLAVGMGQTANGTKSAKGPGMTEGVRYLASLKEAWSARWAVVLSSQRGQSIYRAQSV